MNIELETSFVHLLNANKLVQPNSVFDILSWIYECKGHQELLSKIKTLKEDFEKIEEGLTPSGAEEEKKESGEGVFKSLENNLFDSPKSLETSNEEQDSCDKHSQRNYNSVTDDVDTLTENIFRLKVSGNASKGPEDPNHTTEKEDDETRLKEERLAEEAKQAEIKRQEQKAEEKRKRKEEEEARKAEESRIAERKRNEEDRLAIEQAKKDYLDKLSEKTFEKLMEVLLSTPLENVSLWQQGQWTVTYQIDIDGMAVIVYQNKSESGNNYCKILIMGDKLCTFSGLYNQHNFRTVICAKQLEIRKIVRNHAFLHPYDEMKITMSI